jgi:hypothetical protein
MKILTQTILALLIVSLIGWVTISENKNKALENDLKQQEVNFNISLDSLKNEIYVKDSIVMDIEGIVKDQKDCVRFKRIYNKAE